MTFSTRRRLSGKGRFVSVNPTLIELDLTTGTYMAIGDGKAAINETIWNLIHATGALRKWASADEIAIAVGLVSDSVRVTGHARRKVKDALRWRDGLDMKTETRRGQRTTLYPARR